MAASGSPPIDFAALNAALLPMASSLVAAWLPGGQQVGHEYKAARRSQGGVGDSLSVNLNTGAWAHFAADRAGKDLVSLYAYLHDLDNGAAAVALAHEHGLQRVANVRAPAPDGAPTRAALPPPPPAPLAREREVWTVIAPVPAHAPEPTLDHHARRHEDIEHIARYCRDGELYGLVVRFRTSDGGKDPLPHTWCQGSRNGASRWHWKTWDEPRPLYLPGATSPGDRTVVLVEGEKKADALHGLLEAAYPGTYCVASWPGGSKAWRKAAWTWLSGCTVLLWPDCDGKREQLTRDEREACGDEVALSAAQALKPLLPEEKQPGMAAMLGIGALLAAEHGCTASMLPIPQPLEVADGWDCADAIAAGWDAARMQWFFGQARPLPVALASNVVPLRAIEGGRSGDKPGQSKSLAGADGGDGGDVSDDDFEEYLRAIERAAHIQRREIVPNRKVIIAALRLAPALAGVLGFDELRIAPCARVAWPFRDRPGPLQDTDDLRLGDWLSSTYRLKAASRAALAEAIDTVADESRFHPIRDWLRGIHWDGKPRLDKWLIHVLGRDPASMPPKLAAYMAMVGRFWLLGMVARVMKPGSKFDYSLVLEGPTGRRKSTFFKVLAGEEFFSDTHFDIGQGKDGYEQLEGLWMYELSELTALRKADSEQVKAFFSSQVDRFRGAYGRYVQPHPRQCVIGCSTNKYHYLYDLTGNRRYWPVTVPGPLNIEWLAKWRDQLFAEAMAAYAAGERYAPTLEEEELYFVPEQQKRLVQTAVQARLATLLMRDGAAAREGSTTVDLNCLTTFVTLDQLVVALGADAAKSTAQLEQQIRGWLESMGWQYKRRGSGTPRPYGWAQPKVWPPKVEEEDEEPPPTPSRAPGGSEALEAAGDAPPAMEEDGDDVPF